MDNRSTYEEKEMTKEELAMKYIEAASVLLGGSFSVWDTYNSESRKEGKKITLEYEKIEEKDEKEHYNKIPSRY
tara:strand:+ start:36 stop:257 length:222 start_codon:yes stop_codon:yes gene_type:complete